ncbi:hypothetical protein [Candidatus Enterococcus ikei]|uniref:Phage protein n=1 Tax=Candidatus Enterococcus ikei TaxID=2815326 RepID=A0ABS3GUU6_9ENTE|nr:hypothetical protein [Enterococcus sp. DIV0869a]MBO0438925.1 hypothetical protein [Enterococcus sp. DIV0869a]
MDIVENFFQRMKQTYPGISRSDCEEAMQIALVKTTNSLWKIVKQQRNEIKCRDVKRMEKLLNQMLAEQKKQTKLLQTIASSQEQSKSYGGGVNVVNVGGNHAMRMQSVENHDSDNLNKSGYNSTEELKKLNQAYINNLKRGRN